MQGLQEGIVVVITLSNVATSSESAVVAFFVLALQSSIQILKETLPLALSVHPELECHVEFNKHERDPSNRSALLFSNFIGGSNSFGPGEQATIRGRDSKK